MNFENPQNNPETNKVEQAKGVIKESFKEAKGFFENTMNRWNREAWRPTVVAVLALIPTMTELSQNPMDPATRIASYTMLAASVLSVELNDWNNEKQQSVEMQSPSPVTAIDVSNMPSNLSFDTPQNEY